MRCAYGRGAFLYDATSGERAVYRRGRTVGIELLDLHAGDTVLDIGCGTGLNFPLVIDAVGPAGRVIGLDSSPEMLARANRRIARRGWSNASTVLADAADITTATIGTTVVDAILATYSLSVMADWRAAWANARATLRPGGRVCIVDMQRPTYATPVLTPLARVACAMGGADIDAHPWTLLQAQGHDVRQVAVRAGHIVATAAVIP